jgi:hypothetical protein
MSTASISITPVQTGTAYTNDLNAALDAVDTKHSGAVAPTTELITGKYWLDTSGVDPILKIYRSGWKTLFTIKTDGASMDAFSVNTGALTVSGVTTFNGTFDSPSTILPKLGITSTAAELNALDGITSNVTELNYTDGVTSAIQTQIDTKAPKANPTFTGVPAVPTATLGTNTTQAASTAFVMANAPAVPDSLGVNQTWQTVLRTTDVTYQNTTGRAIAVSGYITSDGDANSSAAMSLSIGATAGAQGVVSLSSGRDGNETVSVFGIVPPSHFYRLSYVAASGGSAGTVLELR